MCASAKSEACPVGVTGVRRGSVTFRGGVWNTLGPLLIVWAALRLPLAIGGNVTEVTAVLHQDALIPCNITEDTEDKAVALILWYKDNSSTPIYTIDARTRDLIQAKHFPGEDMVGRLTFDATQQPPVLRVSSVERDDSGHFRCRVDYRQARTENKVVSLQVVVPPQELIVLDEYGQRLVDLLGPYNEDSTVFLVCEAEGGDPPPEVTWSKNGVLVDDSFTITPQGFVRNELRLGPLRRADLMAELLCQASNNNITLPTSSGVVLELNLKPTEVKISTLVRPLTAGDQVELRCLATGARPFAQITWFKGSERLAQVQDTVSRATNTTLSTVTFTVSPEDNGQNLTCRADNPTLPKSEVSDSLLLNVSYAPQLTLTTAKETPQEGENVTLRCVVDANPAVTTVSWRRDGRVLGVRNYSLHLTNVGRKHSGIYECLASNKRGEGFSNPLQLSVHYAPVCKPGLPLHYADSALQRVVVACEVSANPSDVHFEWVANTSVRVGRISTFATNGTMSLASTVTGTELEYGILLCFASNNVGKQIEPCSFRIVPPGPPESPQNCSVVNVNEESVLVNCVAGLSGGMTVDFYAEVYTARGDLLQSNVSASGTVPRFQLSKLQRDTSFVAIVYAFNAKGRSAPVTVRFSTGVLNSFPSATGSNAVYVLNPLLGFLIFALLLLACTVTFLSIAKHRRHRSQRKRSKEAVKLDKYSPQKTFYEYAPGENYQSPDLITTKYGIPGQPDIADTSHIHQEKLTSGSILSPCFRSRALGKPYTHPEMVKSSSLRGSSCETLELQPAPASVCASMREHSSQGLSPKFQLQHTVAVGETPLISDLIHQGVRRKSSSQRTSLNSTPV